LKDKYSYIGATPSRPSPRELFPREKEKKKEKGGLQVLPLGRI